MRCTGAEEPLDELVGPEHPFSVQEHVDHVQNPGCQEAQEADQEVGYVEPAQGFHFILHMQRTPYHMVDLVSMTYKLVMCLTLKV